MPLDQQSVSGAMSTNFDTLLVHPHWKVDTQSDWTTKAAQAPLYQNQQWLQQQHWQTNGFASPTHYYSSQFSYTNENVPQRVLPQQSASRSAATPHRACITLVFNPNTAGYKASIVKRKRHRTKFTTQQIESLESFYKSRPYITKEERQFFVEQLQVTDKAVKVWFQNRRLKDKREREEQEAEEFESTSPVNEESFQCESNSYGSESSTFTPLIYPYSNTYLNNSHASYANEPDITSIEATVHRRELTIDGLLRETCESIAQDEEVPSEDSGFESDSFSKSSEQNANDENHNGFALTHQTLENYSVKSALALNLQSIESRLTNTADEFGFVTLDDRSMTDLVRALDSILPAGVDINSPAQSENGEESDRTTYTGSIYEPISPAVDDNENEKLSAKWEPFAPDQSLQRLFDLHFC